MILFGGLNGGGKTTLMDAIRLVLYGQRAQCASRGSLAYADFLNQCRSRQAGDEPAQLELSFQQTLNSEPTEFRIRRTWGHLRKNDRDTLEVFENGEPKKDLIDGWDERIEALLPLGISNLFLFDGEQVKDLAEQDTLPPNVIQAIRVLLGLALPERLDADIDVLVARKRKQLAGTEQLQKLEEIEETLEGLYCDRKSVKQEMASLTNKLDFAAQTLHLAQEKYIAEGGKIAAEQAQMQAKLTQIKDQLDTQRQNLRDLAAGSLPLLLVRPLLKKAEPHAHDEVRQQQYELAKDLLTEQNQALIAFATETFTKKQTQQLSQFLDQQQAQFTYTDEPAYLHLSAAQLDPLVQLLTHTLATQRTQAKQHLKAIRQSLTDIEALERYLATAAPDEIYQKLATEVTDAQTHQAQLQGNYAHAEQRLNQVRQAIERSKKDLQAYSQLAIDFKNTDHLLKTAAKVKATLAEFKQRLKLHKLNNLEELVTKHFLYLIRKPDFVHRVQIDTETFSLALFDQGGHPIPKNRLSAGEQQLLAIALLWGLANASGRQLPVAIDTPLGRLDSKHRRHLVERYFPQASHQVLLLSTDTEIRKEEVERLRKQGAIAHEYLLNYHLKDRHTTIEPGYFW
ncbi:MAG: DNA sulfur modification protein DndD [Cyanobacteria bacterium J06648_16]